MIIVNLKLNLSTVFEALDGTYFKDEKGEYVHMKDVIRTTVTAELPDDGQGNAQDVIAKRMQNFDIYLKVRNLEEGQTDIELTPEEIVHIKNRVVKIYHTLISGPTVRILNGKDPYKN